MKTNLMQVKINANASYKQLVNSLDFVIDTLNDMARTDERVKMWFDETGVNVRPRQKKHEKEGKFYLTAERIIKAWECKDEEGNLCKVVKGKKRVVTKFSAWVVMTMCAKSLKEKTKLERAKKEIKKRKEESK